MRRLNRIAFASALLVAAPAAALPSVLSSTGSDDDATISLTTIDASIIGDSRTPCTLEFSDAGTDVVFTDGDSIYIAVWEDDLAGDELLWDTTIEITSGMLTDGAYSATFDCSSDFGEDGAGGQLEIYAEADVTKAECGTWCLYDVPTTANLDVDEVIDDEAEEDDIPDDGPLLLPGRTEGRVLADQDNFAIILLEPARIELTVHAIDAHGPVAVTLDTPEGERVVDGVRGEESIVFAPGALAVGTYFLTLQPAERPDYAFYDVSYTVDVGACADADTQEEPCGACGTRSRTCAAGEWSAWSDCSDEGECAPGDSRTDDCGNCGFSEVSCTETCEWSAGECTGQGDCSAGDVETADCGEEGTQARECDEECAWTEFSACEEPELECTSGLGGVCDSDDGCCDGWSCLGSPEEPWFSEGYCSSLGCESDDDCGDGICASVFGAWTCLAPCDNDTDCPDPSYCLNVDGDDACAPRCESDEDCTDPDLPVCLDNGGCGPDEGGEDVGPGEDVGEPDVGEPDVGEPDVEEDVSFDRGTGADTQDQDSATVGGGGNASDDGDDNGAGGGCSAASSTTSPAFGFLLLGLIGLRRRRR